MQLHFILSEESQIEKDPMPHDITYMRNVKYDTNEHMYETENQKNIESRLVL